MSEATQLHRYSCPCPKPSGSGVSSGCQSDACRCLRFYKHVDEVCPVSRHELVNLMFLQMSCPKVSSKTVRFRLHSSDARTYLAWIPSHSKRRCLLCDPLQSVRECKILRSCRRSLHWQPGCCHCSYLHASGQRRGNVCQRLLHWYWNRCRQGPKLPLHRGRAKQFCR